MATDGSVCLGSMRRPQSSGAASYREWETGFWESEFSHPGMGVRLTTRKGGVLGLWRSLIGKQHFPLAALLPAGETLQQFLRR